MSWHKIIGHDKIKRILQNAIKNNRIAHAYCFTGIHGIGKDALAIQFAKTVNCEHQVVIDDFIDSCDECHTCRQFDSLSHPNIELLFSLPAGKSSDSRSDSQYDKLSSEQIDIIKEELEQKAANPYLPIYIPNASQIKISGIRDVKQKFAMSSFNGKRRFLIVLKAEEMNQEAANAFLKTLEEPQENITIIMITSKPESLLQTIMSRCQQIIIPPLDDSQIIRKLITDNNIPELDARIASRFAQGSYLKALEFTSDENKTLRNEVVDLLRTSLKKAKYREELVTGVESLIKSKDKNLVSRILQMLMFWLNDANLLKIGGSPQDMVNIDDVQTIEKFYRVFGSKDIEKAIIEIDTSISLIYRNVALNLILISLFIRIRRIFID